MCRRAVALVTVLLVWLAGPAEAASRTLKLYFTHTKETLEITYKRNGRYVPSALKEINRFLRDWRRNESTKIDPELLDLVWEVYRDVDAREPIHVVSAYRSPATNNMLRQRSRGVAKQSQHMAGRAMDFFIPGVPLAKLRAAAFKKQVGGVGYYPTSGSPFVHLDTGRVRAWPRMPREQLVKIFPDGKTLHLPADGKPLTGYAEAQALEKAGKLAALDRGGGFGLPSFGFGRGRDRGEDGGRTLVASASGPERDVIRPGTARSEGGAVVDSVLSSERSRRADAVLARAEVEPEAAEDAADEDERHGWGLGSLIGRFRGSTGDGDADSAGGTDGGETRVAAASPDALPGVGTSDDEAQADPIGRLAAQAKVPLPRPAPREVRLVAGMKRPIVVAALPQARPVGFVSDPTLLGYSAQDAVVRTGEGDRALAATRSLLPADDTGSMAVGRVANVAEDGSSDMGSRDSDDGAGFVLPNPRDPMLLDATAPIEGEWFAELIPHDRAAARPGDGSALLALSDGLSGTPLRFSTDTTSTWSRPERFRGLSIVVFRPPRG